MLSFSYKITPMTPSTFISKYNDGTLGTFDSLVTWGALEHRGLGRYGDGVHPWSDLVAMARAWCVLKEGARALVAVPASKWDTVRFNLHRWVAYMDRPHIHIPP